jgi:hypothetical protein
VKKVLSVIFVMALFHICIIASGVEAGEILDAKFLSKIADTINKKMGLPKQLNEDTILKSVTHAHSALVYTYIMIKVSADDLDTNEVGKRMKEYLLSQGACKQFGKYIFNNELIVRYKYYGQNRNLICSFDITKRDCSS